MNYEIVAVQCKWIDISSNSLSIRTACILMVSDESRCVSMNAVCQDEFIQGEDPSNLLPCW